MKALLIRLATCVAVIAVPESIAEESQSEISDHDRGGIYLLDFIRNDENDFSYFNTPTSAISKKEPSTRTWTAIRRSMLLQQQETSTSSPAHRSAASPPSPLLAMLQKRFPSVSPSTPSPTRIVFPPFVFNFPTLPPTSSQPTQSPSFQPTSSPSLRPSPSPSSQPSPSPSSQPTITPSSQPTITPSSQPTITPSSQPTITPSSQPTITPSSQPTVFPSLVPSLRPSPPTDPLMRRNYQPKPSDAVCHRGGIYIHHKCGPLESCGRCYHFGRPFQSCDEICAEAHGGKRGKCDVMGTAAIGSWGDLESCVKVVESMGLPLTTSGDNHDDSGRVSERNNNQSRTRYGKHSLGCTYVEDDWSFLDENGDGSRVERIVSFDRSATSCEAREEDNEEQTTRRSQRRRICSCESKARPSFLSSDKGATCLEIQKNNFNASAGYDVDGATSEVGVGVGNNNSQSDNSTHENTMNDNNHSVQNCDVLVFLPIANTDIENIEEEEESGKIAVLPHAENCLSVKKDGDNFFFTAVDCNNSNVTIFTRDSDFSFKENAIKGHDNIMITKNRTATTDFLFDLSRYSSPCANLDLKKHPSFSEPSTNIGSPGHNLSQYNTSECNTINSGYTCKVSCLNNFNSKTTFTCPSFNYISTQQPLAPVLPKCYSNSFVDGSPSLFGIARSDGLRLYVKTLKPGYLWVNIQLLDIKDQQQQSMNLTIDDVRTGSCKPPLCAQCRIEGAPTTTYLSGPASNENYELPFHELTGCNLENGQRYVIYLYLSSSDADDGLLTTVDVEVPNVECPTATKTKLTGNGEEMTKEFQSGRYFWDHCYYMADEYESCDDFCKMKVGSEMAPLSAAPSSATTSSNMASPPSSSTSTPPPSGLSTSSSCDLNGLLEVGSCAPSVHNCIQLIRSMQLPLIDAHNSPDNMKTLGASFDGVDSSGCSWYHNDDFHVDNDESNSKDYYFSPSSIFGVNRFVNTEENEPTQCDQVLPKRTYDEQQNRTITTSRHHHRICSCSIPDSFRYEIIKEGEKIEKTNKTVENNITTVTTTTTTMTKTTKKIKLLSIETDIILSGNIDPSSLRSNHEAISNLERIFVDLVGVTMGDVSTRIVDYSDSNHSAMPECAALISSNDTFSVENLINNGGSPSSRALGYEGHRRGRIEVFLGANGLSTAVTIEDKIDKASETGELQEQLTLSLSDNGVDGITNISVVVVRDPPEEAVKIVKYHDLTYYEFVRDTYGKPTKNADVVEIPSTLPPSLSRSFSSLSNPSKTWDLRHFVVFLPLTGKYDGSASPMALQTAASAIVALRHFNYGIGYVSPDVATLSSTSSCNLKFTLEFVDTQGDPMRASRTFFDSIIRRRYDYNSGHDDLATIRPMMPTVLLGTNHTNVTESLSSIASSSNVPLISHVSSSTILDNKDMRRLFGRIAPSFGEGANAALDFLSGTLGATHIYVLLLDDDVGQDFRIAFEMAAEQRMSAKNVIVKFASFSGRFDEEEDISETIGKLKDSGYRYFFGDFQYEHYEAVMNEAQKQGIAGSGYFWMFSSYLHELPYRLALPWNSSLINATHGSAILPLSQAFTSDPTKSRLFEKSWRDALLSSEATTSAISYFDSKMPKNVLQAEGYGERSVEAIEGPKTPIAYLMYDAVMASAFASCKASGNTNNHTETNRFFDGVDFFNSFLDTKFEGASGTVSFDYDTGGRDHRTIGYPIWNILANDRNEDGMVTFRFETTHRYVSARSNDSVMVEWDPVEQSQAFVFSDGTNVPPQSLPPMEEDMHLLGRGTLAFGLSMCGFILSLSIFFGVWTNRNRQTRVVKASQPMFLGMLCLGTSIIILTIIPMSIQEPVSNDSLDVACMSLPWIFSIGFIIAFSALFSKLDRVKRIFSGKSHSRVTVRARDVLRPFLVLFTTNAVVLLAWTFISPLKHYRITMKKSETDKFGREYESYSSCLPEHPDRPVKAFILVWGTVNLIALLCANYQAYAARKIATEYSESHYIGISMAMLLQACFIGVPLLFIVGESPSFWYVLTTCLITITCAAILFPMFIPKFVSLRQWKREEAEKRERKRQRIMRNKEFNRRVSGLYSSNQYSKMGQTSIGTTGSHHRLSGVRISAEIPFEEDFKPLVVVDPIQRQASINAHLEKELKNARRLNKMLVQRGLDLQNEIKSVQEKIDEARRPICIDDIDTDTIPRPC